MGGPAFVLFGARWDNICWRPPQHCKPAHPALLTEATQGNCSLHALCQQHTGVSFPSGSLVDGGPIGKQPLCYGGYAPLIHRPSIVACLFLPYLLPSPDCCCSCKSLAGWLAGRESNCPRLCTAAATATSTTFQCAALGDCCLCLPAS